MGDNMGQWHYNHMHHVLLLDILWKGMSTQGCAFFKRSVVFPQPNNSGSLTVDFCDPEDIMLQKRRSIRPFCPRTCRCDAVLKAKYLQTVQRTWSMFATTECPEICLR